MSNQEPITAGDLLNRPAKTNDVFEQLARYRRSTALADVLQATGISSETASTFKPGQWSMVAALALNPDGSHLLVGIKPPSPLTAGPSESTLGTALAST